MHDKPLAAEVWHKLLTSIMVVDTVREPYSLKILFKGLEIIAIPIALLSGIESLKKCSYLKIIPSVLVEEYVPAP